jgi:hypothetical protein
MLLDHRAHPFHRRAADALLFGLAIDDIAGGGHGNTCQLCNITEFHADNSLFFVVHAPTFWPILTDKGSRPRLPYRLYFFTHLYLTPSQCDRLGFKRCDYAVTCRTFYD